MQDSMIATLRVYQWPSQAFWRYFEVQALRKISCEHPILEIGCGDGRFSSMVFEEIDEAIDVNPRSVEKCRKMSGGLYRRLRCLDVRELTLQDGGFATVYANCVLEHVPEIEKVLAGCFRGLRPGGKLVITIPLVRMNRHLLFPWGWYARLRQRQLAHINLLSESGWEDLLRGIGFSVIEFHPYLSGKACKFWDTIDSPGCVGVGRYRVATVLGRLAGVFLPRSVRAWLLRYLASWLSEVAEANGTQGPPCAAVLIARKDCERATT
jgi:SAM-dependent methyltransferase